MAVRVDQIITTMAAANDFVVTRKQLQDAGVSRSAITRRIGRSLVPFASGVFTLGGPAAGRQLIRASLEAVEKSVIADETAAHRHGLPIRDIGVLSIAAPKGHVATLPDEVRLRATRHLPPCDLTTVDGFPVTTVERTICDLAATVPPKKTQHLIEWAITQRLMSSRSFVACARSFCRRGRKGSAVVRLLSHELLDEQPVPASVLEREGRRVFSADGTEGFDMHFVPPWSDGVTGVVDFAWPDERVIVELDGRRWHMTTKAMQADRRRDRQAASHQWVVLRFGWQEVMERPSQVFNEVRWMLNRRRRTDPPT